MPRLSPQHVNTVRTIVTWSLRTLAVALLAAGTYLFLKKLFFALGDGMPGVDFMFQVYDGIGETHATYRGLAMIVVGAVLAPASRRIARWIVSVPEEGCPRCGYAGAVTDTCPECGQRDMPVG